MKTVWKYPVLIDEHFDVEMPAGAEVLHVDWQEGLDGALWALVDDTVPAERRRFRLAGTGQRLPDYEPSWRFVGTFLIREAALVFHLWEIPRTEEPTP